MSLLKILIFDIYLCDPPIYENAESITLIT